MSFVIAKPSIQIILACSFLFVFSSLDNQGLSASELYRWTDASGSVHVTDYPPPQNEIIINSIKSKPPAPASPKSAANKFADLEIEKMEIEFRAHNRWAEKQQMKLRIKLLEAEGYPYNSAEADAVRKEYADKLLSQAMERSGLEKAAILKEYIQMQMEIADVGAIYKYEKRR